MTDQDPRIGRPVQRNVQVDGVWYRPGQVPSTEHALRITNRRVWGDDMSEVPGPSQFATDGDGNVVPPAGQPVAERPEQPVPSTEESVTEPAPEDAEEQFDPAAHNAADVQAYLDGLGDDEEGRAERQRVMDAERSGKARKGIVGE